LCAEEQARHHGGGEGLRGASVGAAVEGEEVEGGGQEQQRRSRGFEWDIYTARSCEVPAAGKREDAEAAEARHAQPSSSSSSSSSSYPVQSREACCLQGGSRQYFPDELSRAALSARLERTSAFAEGDRVRLINRMLGTDDDDAPLPSITQSSHAYEAFDQKLQGHLAAKFTTAT
jgi:hypothetical protein